MRVLTALLQTLAVGATLTLDAATPQIAGGFTQINMQDGGFLTGIVQHPSGRLIARTDGGGIYRSDNQGNWWTFLDSNMVTSASLCAQGVAVPQTSASSSNLILMACGWGTQPTNDYGRGVWKTTDGGATWTQTLKNVWFSGGDNERVGGECIIFHPTNDSEVFVGTRSNGLWSSLDAGSTWTLNTALSSNIIISSVYIHPSYPDQIFVAGDGGLWASVDHGTTWTQLKTFTLVYRVTRGADGTVYYSGVNGSKQLIQKITATSWANTATYTYTDLYTPYTTGIGDNGLALITVTVLKDGRLVVSDEYGNARISANEGTSFSTINFKFAPGIPVPQWASATTFEWRATSLIQDVKNTNFWYGGGGYGPIATTNSGTNWQYIPNGIGEVVAWRVCFHATDSNRFYIPCMDLGGAIVNDGGISGNTVSMPFQSFRSDVTLYAHRVLACKTNGYNRAIFAGGSELKNLARLYTTTNDGANWYVPASVGLPTTVNGAVIDDAIDSLDNPDDFLVVCGGYTSSNGMYTNNSASGYGGVYRTTNAGASFTQCNWYPTNNQFLGAFQYTFVYLDRDATSVNVRYLFSHAAYPSLSALTNSGGGFFVSTDRGVTWTQKTGFSGGLISGNWSDWGGMMAADHGISGHIWIALQTSPTSCCHNGLAYSADSGTTFSAVGGFTNALFVDAFKGNVVACGQMPGDTWNKIYYSTNNGTSWGLVTATNYAFGNVGGVSLDPYRPGRIFISTGERSVGIFTPGTPLQQWKLEYFGSTNSSQSGNGANPNSNGIPNLVEYALGADPLAGLSSDPLGAGSANATNYLPCATVSTNPPLAGQPVLRLNLPDSPPSDIKLQVLSSPDLVNWSTNAMRIGANAWQWVGSGPSLVAPGPDTNGRALFDIGTPDWTNASGEFQCLQVSTN